MMKKRPFLKKDRVNSPSYGDVLYIGSTGDRSNTNQTAMLFTQSAGIMMGSGNDNGNNITEKWLTIESDKTVLYPNATNGFSNIGDGNFIINDDDNTGFGGMYVNATQPFYGYAAAGSVKAYTHYAESNGIKYLKWNIASGDKMKLDGSGNLEINGGEYKYSTAKTRYYSIPPAEIKSSSHSYNVSFLSGCAYISDGNSQTTGFLFAPINLPSGAELVEVKFYLYDNDYHFDFGTFGLWYKSLSSSTSSSYNISATNNVVNQNIVLDLTPSSTITIDNSSNTYWLRMETKQANQNLRIKGIRVEYRVDKAE